MVAVKSKQDMRPENVKSETNKEEEPMKKKVRVLVEKFDNGIGYSWIDGDEEVKRVAMSEVAALALGKELADDIFNVFDKCDSDAVTINIEYSDEI